MHGTRAKADDHAREGAVSQRLSVLSQKIDEAVAQTTFFAAVSAAHEADTPDPGWSRRGEDDIGALVAARAGAFALERADCRSHTCVAQLRALAREGSSGALEDLVVGLHSVFADVSVDRQPSGALKIYLAR